MFFPVQRRPVLCHVCCSESQLKKMAGEVKAVQLAHLTGDVIMGYGKKTRMVIKCQVKLIMLIRYSDIIRYVIWYVIINGGGLIHLLLPCYPTLAVSRASPISPIFNNDSIWVNYSKFYSPVTIWITPNFCQFSSLSFNPILVEHVHPSHFEQLPSGKLT